VSAVEPVEHQGGVRASLSLLRRNRDFRRLYLASVISLGGDWFLLVALFGLALELSGAIAVGLVVAAQEIPFFLMSPLGGVLADRLNRKRLMIACDVSRAILCLGFLAVHDEATIWVALALLAVISCFSAAFDPASSAAVPNVVDPQDLGPANALTGSLWGTMLAVGSALGGLVAATLGREAAFTIDAASFALSALLIAGVRRPFSESRGPDERHPGVVEATVETARYAKRDHRVLALLGVKAGFGLGAGVIVLLSVYAERVFHRGEIGIGILMASRGVGALVGPFLGRSLAGRDDRRLFGVIGLALLLFGLAYAVLGLMPTLLLAAVVVCVAHLGGGAQWTLSTYGLQRIVPDRILGRAFAADQALVTLTLTASSLVTAWSANRFGPRLTSLALGAIAIAWALVWTWLTTDVRRALARSRTPPAAEAGPASGARARPIPPASSIARPQESPAIQTRRPGPPE
jgi:MFS family permease